MGGRPIRAGIGVRAGKVTSRPEAGWYFLADIGERPFAWSRDQAGIDVGAAFDGIYLTRTRFPPAAGMPLLCAGWGVADR